MKIKARLNYLRMPPRKARLAADAVRGRSVQEAERVLRFLSRRAAHPIRKLLASAVANAKHNFQIASPDELVISEIAVNGGPTLKRSRPRAFGRSFPIRKRTSRVTLVLESRAEPPKRRKPKKAAVAVLRREPAERETLSRPAAPKPEPFRIKPKVATKPTDFARRMFRRKAI